MPVLSWGGGRRPTASKLWMQFAPPPPPGSLSPQVRKPLAANVLFLLHFPAPSEHVLTTRFLYVCLLACLLAC